MFRCENKLENIKFNKLKNIKFNKLKNIKNKDWK